MYFFKKIAADIKNHIGEMNIELVVKKTSDIVINNTKEYFPKIK